MTNNSLGFSALYNMAAHTVGMWKSVGVQYNIGQAFDEQVLYYRKEAARFTTYEIEILIKIASSKCFYPMCVTDSISSFLYQDDPWRHPGKYGLRESGYALLYAINKP